MNDPKNGWVGVAIAVVMLSLLAGFTYKHRRNECHLREHQVPIEFREAMDKEAEARHTRQPNPGIEREAGSRSKGRMIAGTE